MTVFPETERWKKPESCPKDGRLRFGMFYKVISSDKSTARADFFCWVENDLLRVEGWWLCDPDGNFLEPVNGALLGYIE